VERNGGKSSPGRVTDNGPALKRQEEVEKHRSSPGTTEFPPSFRIPKPNAKGLTDEASAPLGRCLFFVVFAAFLLSRAHWNPRTHIGAALAAAGFALWTTARLQLGRSFSLRAKANVLVTTGLYSKFRHPIYLFGFFAYLGLFLIWGKWTLLTCFLLVYSPEIIRSKKEDRVLEQAFGEEYRRYRARTWL